MSATTGDSNRSKAVKNRHRSNSSSSESSSPESRKFLPDEMHREESAVSTTPLADMAIQNEDNLENETPIMKSEQFNVESGHHHQPQPQAGWTGYLIYSVIASMLGSSFVYGYHTGVINAPYDVMSKFVNESRYRDTGKYLTDSELNTRWSLVVSLYLVGGVVGSCWVPDLLASRFGRKRSLLFTSVIGAIGSLLSFISPYCKSDIPLLLGRVIVGLHSGIVMVIVPALLVEIPPARLRGACGSLNELTIVSGITLSCLVSLPYLLGSQELWHVLFILMTAVMIIHAVMMLFAAESPRWLIDQKRDDEAIQVLKKLRRYNDEQVRPEFEETKQISEAESAVKKVSIRDIFRTRQIWWPLFLTVHLHVTQQLTGVGAVAYYASLVMADAGLGDDMAKVANFGISVVFVVTTAVSAAIVDRVGRRILMLIGVAGMGLSMVLLTIVLSVKAFYGSIAGFALFYLSFSIGPGPIAFFMTAEMFTQASRPVGLSVGLFVNWATNLAVGLLFPLMQEYLLSYAFLPFAILCFIEFVFLLLFLPETSGISLEEIVAKFEPGKPLIQLNLKRRVAALSQR